MPEPHATLEVATGTGDRPYEERDQQARKSGPVPAGELGVASVETGIPASIAGEPSKRGPRGPLQRPRAGRSRSRAGQSVCLAADGRRGDLRACQPGELPESAENGRIPKNRGRRIASNARTGRSEGYGPAGKVYTSATRWRARRRKARFITGTERAARGWRPRRRRDRGIRSSCRECFYGVGGIHGKSSSSRVRARKRRPTISSATSGGLVRGRPMSREARKASKRSRTRQNTRVGSPSTMARVNREWSIWEETSSGSM